MCGLTIAFNITYDMGVWWNHPFQLSKEKAANMTNSESESSSADSPITELSLEDRVRISFEQLGYPQLNAIQCIATDDLMLLTGELSSFYLKQVAQSVAVKIPGVREVRNEIQVR